MTEPRLLRGDCVEVLRGLPENSVDAVVTDPPYGLAFMGKRWDYDVPGVEVWRECLRVLKPGGYLLAFAGTRTQHRMCVNIEDAGFEIRDMIAWVYGSGFPKSHDISKGIDKADARREQEERRLRFTEWVRKSGVSARDIYKALRSCGLINEGSGMGSHYTASTLTAQPAIMTREHLEACRHLFPEVPEWVEEECDKRTVESKAFKSREVKGQYCGDMGGLGGTRLGQCGADITAPATDAAKQWEGWGTALKPALEPITVARKPFKGTVADNVIQHGTGAINIDACRIETEQHEQGRWPANLIHDGSDEVLDVFPDDSARFFYCPKAQKDDRDAGLSRATTSAGQKTNRKEGSAGITPYTGTRVPTRNNHPTVKPVALMRYLCRLVTQPGGVVLDPFMGSGTTGRACLEEGFAFVGIERDPEYFQLCKERMNRVQLPLFGGA